MGADDAVRRHYGGDELERRVLDAVRAAGRDVERLQVSDLAGLDHLHAGGVPATAHLLDRLELIAGTPLLDVGSGVGGPARLAAARHGCPVTGIDLSPDFVALARSLTERVGLGGLVSFDEGSATDLPYDDATFARAMLVHAGMNMPEKGAVFAEVRRVLAPRGLFGLYEQVRTGDGDLTYPLPWADDASSSFVETRERYVELLAEAGFRVELDENRTAANGPPPPGALGPEHLFGPAFSERLGNAITAALAGTLSSVVVVARAV